MISDGLFILGELVLPNGNRQPGKTNKLPNTVTVSKF